MSHEPNPEPAERWESLVDEVTEGSGTVAELAALEKAAAAVHTALLRQKTLSPLPPQLREKILAGIPASARPQAAILRPHFRAPFVVWGGWMAAAACLVVALGWELNWKDSTRRAASPSAAALFRALESAPDLIRVVLPSTTPGSGTPSGEILWSSALQEGVLRLKGLSPNDPRTEQFQLWIVDPLRDASFPVDGGVFDVASGAEAVIPIQAKLRIAKPTAFVITREHPGGVVKSQSKSPVLVASVR